VTPPLGLPLEIRDELPIGTGWRQVAGRAPVRFPYTGEVIASAPVGSVADAADAIEAAVEVRPQVAALPTHERRRVLRETHATLASEADALADLLVLETGKPLADCRTEVTRTLLTFEVAAEEAARITGETVPLDLLPSGEGLVGFWVRRPIGVVVGITGFNYPLLLAAHKVAPAIAAGCPIVVKPAPATPLASLHLVDVMRSVGVPPAAVQLVTGDAEVGDTLVRHDATAAVSFTGSAAVGHMIAANAGAKRVVLELGSNAPLIVAADADVAAAADACVRGGFYASGQACISVQRILVEEAVADRFVDALADRVRDVVVGDPREPDTQVAAVIDERAAARIGDWIEAAVAGGAQRVVGGEIDGAVVAPTLLVDVPDGVSAWDEEVFGPVVCVRTVGSFDEAIETANRTAYGLHASVWTSDLARAFAAAERLEVGGVLVNEVPGFRADNMPYGGVKRSGLGREGPRFAIEEFTVTKMVMIRPTPAQT